MLKITHLATPSPKGPGSKCLNSEYVSDSHMGQIVSFWLSLEKCGNELHSN